MLAHTHTCMHTRMCIGSRDRHGCEKDSVEIVFDLVKEEAESEFEANVQ